jgi:hypothetical protein
MRAVLLVGLLVMSLAAPGLAAANSDLSYNLSVSGAIGGVPVSGTVTSGACLSACTTTLYLGTSTVKFAQATLTCAAGCTIDSLTQLAGKPVASPAITAAAISTSTFPTHGAWVSAVAQLANSNRQALAQAGLTVGQVVSGAAKPGDPGVSSHGNSSEKSQADAHGANTSGGNGHGGGNGGGNGGGHR